MEGVEIIPASIGLARFNEFNQQVPDFLTDYRIGQIVPWVKVEKYSFATVIDMGVPTKRMSIHGWMTRGRFYASARN